MSIFTFIRLVFIIKKFLFRRTTLARWRAAQLEQNEKHKKRRPYLASDCKSLYACEKWRMQIIREIAKKVAQIQNGKTLFNFKWSVVKL